MDKKDLTRKIKEKALSLGFATVDITTADDFSDYAEELLRRAPAYDFVINMPKSPYKGAFPRSIMPEAKSIICLPMTTLM
ncbi:hypothetical protein [Serpentinicella alkaliphila]|uniref:Uncharacterized protein n=1 Tax=Serpentinicella alkaliphila TaxID=1734049 RepID=A0A4R2TB02_9FIRM|nr:hypothetical protein [Serpentinicella alkaliphila]QUH26586.1 hypothetical protein HZR23_13215 [Serpentinicella alkaliphila]TCP99071.1 hypothetical protein EDD79_103734 [Serpentinicella alkaliphila]